jgi:hypothetical protein
MELQKRQQPTEPMIGRREIPWWGWLAAIAYMVIVDNLVPSGYEGWALVAGWFALAAMCLVNFSSCGRYHCKITGPGFLGIGTLALLETLGIVTLPGWVTFIALIGVLGVGFGLEYRHRGKEETCYCSPA